MHPFCLMFYLTKNKSSGVNIISGKHDGIDLLAIVIIIITNNEEEIGPDFVRTLCILVC